ncbi:putative nitrilase [Sistotremastrum niveocremeum HHB9708]|uniref:Putative nitrilase n=2 Tax=Sistotremastraceae TaxID=3402574 RepID=A0A165AMZ4_9AGAM|nr:putative nitrilase [Sistotremastrum niveocremeum HHB9708]KZT36977.1 putative nitrilase [Sistotremastrum suecicum HHB10207 ss-3]
MAALRPFRIALIQLGHIGHDKSQNLKHAQEMIKKAASGGGSKPPNLIVLPECFNSPYGHKYFPEYAESVQFKQGEPYDVQSSKSESVKILSAAAKEHGIWLIGGSIPERDDRDDGKLYNTATVYNPNGELIAIHRKVHLFDIEIPGKITFKESTTLSGGTHLTTFDTDFARIGLGICYDVRFPEMAMIAARKGCHAMIYPGAFNLTTGPLHWKLLQQARAVDNQIFVGMCSPARDLTADYHAWGHSLVVDPLGEVLVESGHDEEIVYADIDPSVFESTRRGIPVTTQRRFDVYPNVAV